MSDISDVEMALVAAIAGVLYPAPYASGSIKPTVISGTVAKCYRGWPEAASLDADLANNIAHVSVFAEPGVRNTTRHPMDAQVVSVGAPTLTATASGTAVTFGGTGGAGQVVGVTLGEAPNLQPYPYRLTAQDTPSAVAAALAAKIGNGATATGPQLTIPTSLPVLVRVVADTATLTEVRRQEQRVRVSCWAPNALARDALVKAIDGPLANMPWLTAAEGSAIRLIYFDTFSDDKPTRDKVWRRDLRYCVEFPTTIAQSLPEMLFGKLVVTDLANDALGTFTT